MAHVGRELWPEEHSPFGELEAAVAEPSAGGVDVMIVRQGKEESRAAFDVQELLGHQDVSTTMLYTHVVNRGRLGVRSPFDQAGLAGLTNG